MKILGISGRKGAGKDTIARELTALLPAIRIMQHGFAYPLKEFMVNVFEVPRAAIYGDDAAKNQPMPHNPAMTIRQAAQAMCDTIKTVDRLAPVRFGMAFADCYRSYCDWFMFTDVRFREEVEAIQQTGGKVIRLLRGDSSDNHKTESAGDDPTIPWDAIIDNRGQTVAETLGAVLTYLKGWNYV